MAAIDESAIPWRVGSLERKAEKLDEDKADKLTVEALAGDLRTLRKAVMTAAFAFVGSSVLVSFTLFVTLGSHLAG